MYKFTFSINQDDLFKSSLNYAKHSKTFYFDVFFTIVAIIITIYTIITGSFFALTNLKKLLLIVCCILFSVIQPIILYIKSLNHYKKIKDYVITIIFNENSILLSSNNENTEVLYENVYNFIKYKNMIVIMYDSIHGQIMPDRIFENNKDELYDFVSNKIMLARRKIKENNEGN